MCQLSARIRSTQGWEKLVDSGAKDMWRCEAGEAITIRTSSGPFQVQLSFTQIEYALDELSSYSALYDETSHCQVSCFDRIWETTVAASPTLLSTLNKDLDYVRSQRKCTDANNITTDVVDPYLYPLVYGRTLIKNNPHCDLCLIPPPQVSEDVYGLSRNFAWIPTSFTVSPDALPLHVRACSYISGIDPALRDLYACVEELISNAIPLFEHVLTDLSRDNPLYQRIPYDHAYIGWEWEEPEEPEHSDDEKGWFNYEREMHHWISTRPIVHPDIPPGGCPGDLQVRRSQISLRGETVKVCTRIVDIDLKPGGPSYDGTPWHAAGMRNERIVAVAIQCLSTHNIAPLRVDFRMPVRCPSSLLPGGPEALSRICGLNLNAASHQYVGTSLVRLGQTVVFPNIYQHRLTETCLEDSDKEGSMRVAMFYLVDPKLSDESGVLSTSVIPPQEIAWMRKALEDSLDVRVPTEIIDIILDFTEGLMNNNDALRYATLARDEREVFCSAHDRDWFSRSFEAPRYMGIAY
ncbi:hypothetical protein NM688_g8588 [Phlebia brevispora]|uniref:Uncharacterized protein n=1 Tax=Phlebia brevispora TaxID=194682 RepID=A0ACC1RRQ9_9APHY|nr:hypothetical protein NM688_g8588 [Phlebia brevispora]